MNWATMLGQIDESFSDDELRTLCFELSVDYDNLAADTKKGKARELIAEMQRHGRVNELVEKLLDARPHIAWQRPLPEKQGSLTENMAAQNNGRQRPVMGGDSFSHYRAGAATLGCLVIDPQQPQHLYFLCELSGLRQAGRALRPGDPLIQPGQADAGSLSQDVIATLSRWGSIKDDPLAAAENIAVALAQVQRPEDVSPEIRNRGFVQGIVPAKPGLPVFGVGRSSGLVSGSIQQVDATIELYWPVEQIAGFAGSGNENGEAPILFAGLIRCTPMLQPGDGGMVLLDSENQAVGLGFAGNDEESYFIPIQRVLTVLRVDLVTEKVWQKWKQAATTVNDNPEASHTPSADKPNTLQPQTLTATTDLKAYQNQLADLRRELKRGRLVLFVGADWPQRLTGLPSRAELAAQLAQRKGVAAGSSFTAVTQTILSDGNRWEFTDFLREATDTVGKQPQPIHQAILALVNAHKIETIITTAYDDMLDFTFRQAGQSLDVVVREADLGFVSANRSTLIRLFGHSRQPDTLVVTEQDHNALLRGRLKTELVAEVQHALRRNTVLYLGHDLSDPTILALIDELSQANSPRSYALWAGLSTTEKEFFRSQRNVEILDVDPVTLLQTLADEGK